MCIFLNPLLSFLGVAGPNTETLAGFDISLLHTLSVCTTYCLLNEQLSMPLPEHVSRNFRSPLTWVFAPSLHCSKLYQTAQTPLSTHLKFHSALVKLLHARSNLKEGAIPDVARIWPVCLLFEIFYKLHLSMNDLWYRLTLEGTHESGLVHALDSWRVVSERNWSETEPSLWPLD